MAHRSLPTRKRTNATERKGVAFVRNIVEDANCVFQEIDRAADYGHDAFVLLVDDEKVMPMQIALQIKAGKSYCRAHRCVFTATAAQLNFWAQHPITTLGVVYDPDRACAWWVDLREEARAHRRDQGTVTISFPKADWNQFDKQGFELVLIPTLLDQAPRINLETALAWLQTYGDETHDLGARILRARFQDEPSSWEAMFREFQERGPRASFSIFVSLIQIMGHPDAGFISEKIPPATRQALQSQVLAFGKPEVSDLLHFVDENGFERGSAGYGLFAIIPRLERGLSILRDIADDEDLPSEIRQNASLLIAIHDNDPGWWSLWVPTNKVTVSPGPTSAN